MKIVKNRPKTIYIKDKAPSLKELQDMVGGLIQIIQLKDKQIIIDEEGKLKGKKVNGEASELWYDDNEWKNVGHDVIVGHAVILSGKALLD